MSARTWIVVAALVAAGTGLLDAQSSARPQTDVALGSVLDAGTLRDLPTSGNIFAVLETTQAEVISDRFYTGGVNTGRLPQLGAFLNSTTQTVFHVGDINITGPRGEGAPAFFPDVSFWERVRVETGVTDLGVAAAGLAVSLEPRRPTRTWVRSVEGSLSGSGLIAGTPAGTPPPIAAIDGWQRFSALASGPIDLAHPERMGLAVAGSFSRALDVATRQTARSSLDDAATVTSAFAHLVFRPRIDKSEEIRAVGWVQRSQTTNRDVSFHVQSTWERPVFRAFGAFTQRNRTPGPPITSGSRIDRIADGPVPTFVDIGGGTDRRWSLGSRATAARRTGRAAHVFEAGVDVSGQSAHVGPGFSGALTEVVDSIAARIWEYSNPGLDAERHSTAFAFFAADRIDVTPRLVIAGGVRFDGVSGAATGAANSVSWHTWLPRVTARWAIATSPDLAAFAGYARTADALLLDMLAYGDPAAPVANVYSRMSTEAGQPAVRVGPGTGGNPHFSAIDPSLERPTTGTFVAGLESRPIAPLRLRFSGLVKRAQRTLGVVNVGLSQESFSAFTVHDPGLDLVHADDDQDITVYNRLPASFGQDRYLLTNPAQEASTLSGLVLSLEASADKLFLLFGATASRTDAPAGNRGFHATENDVGVPGELFADPNAGTFSRGRVFSDRAYTMKLTTVYRFSNDFKLGLIARYQDGQPFSRMVVVPGLSQGADAVRAFPNGMSRFTFTGTLDLRLQKGFAVGRGTVSAVLDAYNAINLGNEVEEDVVTGPGFRTVTAVQPPRTVHVGARVTF